MIREFFQWLLRQNPEQTFTETIEETEHFKELISKTKCSACGQTSLKLEAFERGPLGWEIQVSCENCNFKGVVNSQGHKLEQINSKGTARDTS